MITRYTMTGAVDTTFGTDGTGLVVRSEFDKHTGYLSIAFDRDGNYLGCWAQARSGKRMA